VKMCSEWVTYSVRKKPPLPAVFGADYDGKYTSFNKYFVN